MAKRPKPASAPRAAQAADATVSVAGAILRVIGTIFLILLVTGLLFLCIFAYYVKNCLSTDLDVQLSDFTVSLSSSILYEDADGNWQKYFTQRPDPLTEEEIRAYLAGIDGVSLGSDAFFPFSDNIERARKSGVRYVAEPGGSIRDDAVIECCNRYNMVMAFTGVRLFHH